MRSAHRASALTLAQTVAISLVWWVQQWVASTMARCALRAVPMVNRQLLEFARCVLLIYCGASLNNFVPSHEIIYMLLVIAPSTGRYSC